MVAHSIFWRSSMGDRVGNSVSPHLSLAPPCAQCKRRETWSNYFDQSGSEALKPRRYRSRIRRHPTLAGTCRPSWRRSTNGENQRTHGPLSPVRVGSVVSGLHNRPLGTITGMDKVLHLGPDAGVREHVKASDADMSEFEQTVKSAPPKQPVMLKSHRERDDHYQALLVRLSSRCRVIVCRDGIQWIIQRGDGATSGQARWTGAHYCCTRDALMLLCRASCGRIDPAVWAILDGFPAIIGRAAT